MVSRTDIGLEQVDLELKKTLESHEDIFFGGLAEVSIKIRIWFSCQSIPALALLHYHPSVLVSCLNLNGDSSSLQYQWIASWWSVWLPSPQATHISCWGHRTDPDTHLESVYGIKCQTPSPGFSHYFLSLFRFSGETESSQGIEPFQTLWHVFFHPYFLPFPASGPEHCGFTVHSINTSWIEFSKPY